jgi:hypothetical protein
MIVDYNFNMAPPSSPAQTQISALSILLALALYGLLLVVVIGIQYSYNLLFTAGTVFGFLILAAAAVLLWWYQGRVGSVGSRTGLQIALVGGMLLGCLWVVEISINNFIAPALPGRDIIDNIFWALIALGILLLSTLQAYQTGRFLTSPQVGLWSGFISGLFACCMALSMIVFGMRWITQDPLNIAEWAARGAQSGAPSMAAYFAFETYAGAFLHLIVLGLIMGLLLGLIGGLVGKSIQMIVHP